MILLDLMKSSEVRIAGDLSNSLKKISEEIRTFFWLIWILLFKIIILVLLLTTILQLAFKDMTFEIQS